MTKAAKRPPAPTPLAGADLEPASTRGEQQAVGQDLDSSLHVLTCGSVDDGKSTLIGRMLWDARGTFADQRDAVSRQARTAAGTPDFSLLVDGLAAEREQGITIDIAWRYFELPARRLVIIDSPGHVQYTRNMATGASHADIAVLLVDARAGVKEQTRRHAAILDLVGVRRVLLAVNKMDLVDWSQARFEDIERDFLELVQRFGFEGATAIPLSAIHGDNVARRSRAMPWYTGPLLLEHLQQVPARSANGIDDFRFPVQLVIRDGHDFRGLAGTIASGQIRVDDEIVEPLSGKRAHIRRIVTMGRALDTAVAGQAVVLELDTDLDVSRGTLLAKPSAVPAVASGLLARLVWLSDAPHDPARGYLLRTATDLVPVTNLGVTALLDLATLREAPAGQLRSNDIAAVHIDLGRRIAVDAFACHPRTGSFVLVDAATGATVAGGVIDQVAQARREAERSGSFRLTRAALEAGLCADLSGDPANTSEFRRRAQEVALLLSAAGIAVEIDDLDSDV